MQKVYVGIDIGSVSAKVVALNQVGKIVFNEYRRTFGRPADVVDELLDELINRGVEVINTVVTGTGAKLLATSDQRLTTVNEFKAIVKAISMLYPDIRTIFEMGGESSKFIKIKIPPNPPLLKGGLGVPTIIEYGVNGDCAAGTGSFIDQQAGRLHYKVEEIGQMVKSVKKSARVAGRCSVFAKSDMIHAQQKGYTPPEVLKGLCNAVVRNFKATIVKGRHVELKVAFIGGLALNEGVVTALKEVFGLKSGEIFVPKEAAYLGAVGAALLAKELSVVSRQSSVISHWLQKEPTTNDQRQTTILPPLFTKNVRFLRDKIKPYNFSEKGKIDAYLGIDVGSVSTNFVVIDKRGDVVIEIYTYTKARPIEVVSKGLREIKDALGEKIVICGVGTTGSGRELIGELIGADVIKDEITAHKIGAMHVSERLTDGGDCSESLDFARDKLRRGVDTIFEIGGQDAKYIRIENGIVTDFAMNEACAAGTGSFLEEQAIRLGIKIKNEFAELALASRSPISLGERCTVFMERDVNAYQLRGAEVKDIAAGLAYSIATNYLNRVVRGRKIGEHIFFQGGTAYNDAVAVAFSQILKKEITVPPYNGVIGAIGVALLAKELSVVSRQSSVAEVTDDRRSTTRFRGYDIGEVDYTMREFSCGSCTNNCDIQEFNVGGEKTYWGDKCSSKFRKKARTGNKPVIEDLFRLRSELLEKESLVVSRLSLGTPSPCSSPHWGEGKGEGQLTTSDQRPTTIGVPKAMFYYDRFPFWRAYFNSLGFEVVVSDDTNKAISHDSIELSIAEPCYPIKLVSGHVKSLMEKGADYIFLPNVISSDKQPSVVSRQSPVVLPTTDDQRPSTIPYLCPWHQTVPFVVKAVPQFSDAKFLIPTIQFELGEKFTTKCLWKMAKNLGIKKGANKKAVQAAYLAQREFIKKLQDEGMKALKVLEEEGSSGIILVGRPYNIYDTGANLNIPVKLRNFYGVNVIPFDFLSIDEIDITDISDNMFWNYGKKIIASAKFVADRKNLHMIYITNFKCGPDSFIKHFASWCSNKPYLALQFDEHANDAGIITRIEAYLESKGLLKANSNDKIQSSKEIQNPNFKSLDFELWNSFDI